jgi:hypothetical protein
MYKYIANVAATPEVYKAVMLFIHVFFSNDAVSISDCIASNGIMVNE